MCPWKSTTPVKSTPLWINTHKEHTVNYLHDRLLHTNACAPQHTKHVQQPALLGLAQAESNFNHNSVPEDLYLAIPIVHHLTQHICMTAHIQMYRCSEDAWYFFLNAAALCSAGNGASKMFLHAQTLSEQQMRLNDIEVFW